MNYLLGTGFYRNTVEARAWRRTWEDNVLRFACGHASPKRVVTIAVGVPETAHEGFMGTVVNLPYNLGHVGDLLHGRHKHEFCGWSAAVIALASIAYAGGTDLIYLEEDALAFGLWVEATYAELGDAQFAFGAAMTTPPFMQCSQSLFVIRHAFIPTFIRTYLSLGWDGDTEALPENKFATIESRFRRECRRLTFTRDRERPLPYDYGVWSAQKFSPEEMAELRRRGLV